MTFKELRKSKNLSITELGFMLGVSNATVSSWDNGKVPEPLMIKDLAIYLNSTEEEIRDCFRRN